MTPPLTEKSDVTTTTLDGCTRDFKRESRRNRKMRFSTAPRYSPPTTKSQKARPALLLTSCLTDSTSSTNLEPSKSASRSASKLHR